MARLPASLAATLLVLGFVGTATATGRLAPTEIRHVTWTTRADFEGGGVGAVAGVNLDTTSSPGSVAISKTAAGPRPVDDERTLAAGVAVVQPPVISANPERGEYLVVWRDMRGGRGDIIARRADQGGAPIGREIRVSIYPAVKGAPRAAFAASGRWLVVWEDFRTNRYNVQGRVVSADGVLEAPDFPVWPGREEQHTPDVAYNAKAREFLVVWRERGPEGTDIRARRIDHKGKPLARDIAVCTHPADQDAPRVAWNAGTGEYLVLWVDRRNARANIYGRRVGADGTLAGEESAVREVGHDEILTDLVALGGEKGFLMVWDDYREVLRPGVARIARIQDLITQLNGPPPLGVNIVAQLLDSSGAAAADESAVCPEVRNQLLARAALSPKTGQSLVVWQDARRRTDNWDIFARFVEPDGSAIEPEFGLTRTAGSQFGPDVDCDAEGGCLAVWWALLGKGRFENNLVVRRLAPGAGSSGVLRLTSDAEIASASWRSLEWDAELPPGSRIVFRARTAVETGAFDYTPWSDMMYKSGALPALPHGRFLQIEGWLESTGDGPSPVLHEVRISFDE